MARAKQTVIVKKSHPEAKTKKGAEKVARRHADRIYTARETLGSWRFRQRPPGCFVPNTLRTFCLPKGQVCITFGQLKRDAKKRRACR